MQLANRIGKPSVMIELLSINPDTRGLVETATLREVVVKEAAAVRSSGDTSVIVYAWRAGTSNLVGD